MNKTNKILTIGTVLFLLSALLIILVIFSYVNLQSKLNELKKNQYLEKIEALKNIDSDNDKLSDYDEIYVYKTDPNDNDTDKDGYEDELEINKGYDPLTPAKEIVITNPVETQIDIGSVEYEIRGESSPLIDKIEFEIINRLNETKVILLENFKKGDVKWSYDLKDKKTGSSVLAEGKNIVVISAYQKDKVTKKELVINVISSDIKKGVTVKVDWEKELIKQEQDCQDQYCEFDSYIAGKIASADYKDHILYLEAIHGMGTEYKHYIIGKNSEKIYLEENDIKIEGISDLPEEVKLPDSNYTLKKYYVTNPLFSEIKTTKKLFTDEKLGDFYLTQEGCIVVELPDHTAISYTLQMPFINEDGLLEITFTNNEKNNQEYDYHKITGCGALCYYFDQIDEKELKPSERLKIIGTTSTNEYFYEIGDINDKNLKELYNDKNTSAYYDDRWNVLEKNKYTYQEFINLHPLLYWKDPLGRWIQFKNKKFATLAEMCKPVIYLYPEEKIKLNVKVQLNGEFTFTAPEYHDGWNIEVTEGGKIKDLRTGREYEYLYWEGMGLNYPTKDEGWVVKKENLAQFFDQKLLLLGLNEKEIKDFKNFWVNKLSDMPYYKISFLDQVEFNEIAPINFFPLKPKSIIRVMMTAQGLNEFKFIPEQILPPIPKRNGFTVIEWGGVLLR